MASSGTTTGGKLPPVRKTSLYIDDDVDRALAAKAKRERISKAALIRRALEREAGRRPFVKPTRFGVFDGPADLAANSDKYLADGFGRD